MAKKIEAAKDLTPILLKSVMERCVGDSCPCKSDDATKIIETLYVPDQPWQILTEDAAGGSSGVMRVRGVFQRADVINGNKRIYPLSLWEKAMEDEDVVNSIKDRRMLGEVEHPSDGTTNLGRVSHLISKLELHNDGTIFGEAEILPTRAGNDLKVLFENGVKVGISSRGRGSSKVQPGTEAEIVDPEDFKLETFDFVYNPSTPGAYPSRLSGKGESVQEPEHSAKPSGTTTKRKYDMNWKEQLRRHEVSLMDMRKLLENSSAGDLERYRTQLVDIQIDTHRALDEDKTLTPLCEEINSKVRQMKSQLDSKLEGTEDAVISEARKTFERAEKGGAEDKDESADKGGDVTVPLTTFKSLVESAERMKDQNAKLVERISRAPRANAGMVTERRYEAALDLIDALVRKGRKTRMERDRFFQDRKDLNGLLEQVIRREDVRQTRGMVEAIVRKYPALAPYKGILESKKTSKSVRETARQLLIAAKKGIKPKMEVRKGGSTRADLPSPGSAHAKAPIRIDESTAKDRADRGLRVATRAARRFGKSAI